MGRSKELGGWGRKSLGREVELKSRSVGLGSWGQGSGGRGYERLGAGLGRLGSKELK